MPTPRDLRLPSKAAMGRKHFSRRFFLTTLVRISVLAGSVVSSHRTLAEGRQSRLDSHAELTLAAVIDRMVPGDDELPGALALGIDRRIIAINDLEIRRSVTKGMAWLDSQAQRQGASAFLELGQAQQEMILQAALKSDSDGATAITRTLRRLAFTFYYTDPAIMAAFAYSGPPQPNGFSDFHEAPR